jgi:translocation and assembly module TamB
MRKKSATSAPQPAPGDAARAQGRLFRFALWLIGSFALLFAMLAGALYFVAQTESGTRMLWNNLSPLIPGQISGKLTEGTLGNGIMLKDVHYTNGDTAVSIDRLHGRWRLSLRPLSLTVRFLRIGTVNATLAPSEDDDKPLTKPQSLTLPLALDLREVLANKVLIRGEEGETTYDNIRLQARSDSVNHVLQFMEANTPLGRVSAQFKLNGADPFETSGTASLSGSYGKHAYQLKTDVAGSLSALAVTAVAASGDANAKADILATPFERVPVRHAQVHLEGLDPSAFNADWPKAGLRLDVALAPEPGQSAQSVPSVQGPISLINALPGAWNENRLPIASAQADLRLTKTVRQLSQLTLRLPGNARLNGSGELNEQGQGQLALTAEALNLHALHTALKTTRLDGPVSVKLDGKTQTVAVSLADADIGIKADAQLGPEQILLNQATLSSGEAQLSVSGRLARLTASDYALEGALKKFDPARFLAQQALPKKRATGGKGRSPFQADINMDFRVHGSLQPELSADLRFDIQDSAYAGQPMTGGGHVRLSGKRVLSSDAQLRIAGNRATVKGAFGEPGDRLAFDINAPALARLGFGLSGSVNAEGQLSGTPERPELTASYRAKNLKAGELAVASLNGNAQLGGLPDTAPDAITRLKLSARTVRSGDIRLDAIDADIAGSYRNHTLRLESDGSIGNLKADLSLSAQGKLTSTPQGLAWAGTVNKLSNAGTPQLALAAPVSVDYAPGRLAVGEARLTLARALVQLQHFRYDGRSIATEGRVRQLDTAYLLSLYKEFSGASLPVNSTLVLNGDWNLALGTGSGGTLRIERTSGDVSVIRGARQTSLGISQLALRADLSKEQVRIDAKAQASRIGSLEAQGSIALDPAARWALPDQASALSARVTLRVPNLQTLTVLAGPAVNVEGTAAADLTISGSLGNPVLSGSVDADQLGFTLYDQGVRLRDGVARLRIENDIVEIQKFEMFGGGGSLRMTGRIPLDQSSPDLKADIVADKLQVLSGPEGRLTLSGQATASNVAQQLSIAGKFIVDRALFSLPEKSAPELSDDVVIIRDSKSQKQVAAPGTDPGNKPAGPFSPRVSIEVDLGNRFRFEGAGAELRLVGSIRVESAPGETLQAFGTVRVAEGMYEAFGAELNIERGIINFQGPLNNPNINILAMRREQDVSAGVQITGNVKKPRVQLVSDPNLPDDEKLSWLVFGRSGGGNDPGQAQSAAKGAALGLLNKLGGNRIGDKLGLDEFSIGQSEFGMDGAQVVNLGKEINDRLSIGFEQSLASAASVLKITYELSRHWSVVLRGGDVTGIDMAYNKRFDHWFRPARKAAAGTQAGRK